MEHREIISKFDEILFKYKQAHELELEALTDLCTFKCELLLGGKLKEETPKVNLETSAETPKTSELENSKELETNSDNDNCLSTYKREGSTQCAEQLPKEIMEQLPYYQLESLLRYLNGMTAMKLPVPPKTDVKTETPKKNNKILFCRKCHSRIYGDNYTKTDNGLYLCEKCSKK